MPIPTKCEILRLQVIADNNRRLQEALHHENSVYAQLNKKALEDADLFARTGRVRTPSLPPSSNSDADVSGNSAGETENTIQSTEEEELVDTKVYGSKHNDSESKEDYTNAKGDVCNLREDVDLTDLNLVIVLSSDTEEDFCQCHGLAGKGSTPNTQVTCTKQRSKSGDADYFVSEVVRKEISSSTAAVKQDEVLENDLSANRNTSRVHSLLPFGETNIKSFTTEQHKDFTPVEPNMVTSKKKVNVPEPLVQHEKREKSRRKQGKGVAKVVSAEDNADRQEFSVEPSTSHVRKRKVPKEGSGAKGNKLSKNISPAVVDIVFGNAESPKVDVEEQRRKVQEDALKCGRKIRSVFDVENENSSPMKSSRTEHMIFARTAAGASSKSALASENINSRAVFTDVPTEQEKDAAEVLQHFNTIEEEDHAEGYNETRNSLALEEPRSTPRPVQSNTSLTKKDTVVKSRIQMKDYLQESTRIENKNTFQRSPSPETKYCEKYGRQEEIAYVSAIHQVRGCRSRSQDYMRRSPTPEHERRNCIGKSRSPTPSRSSAYHRRERECMTEGAYKKDIRRHHVTDRHFSDDGFLHVRRIDEHQNEQSNHLSATDGRFRQERSLSPYRRRETGGIRSYSRSTSPAVKKFRTSRELSDENYRFKDIVRREENVVSISSMDRRSRRYKEAVREEAKLERKRTGKKPFYVTLCPEGKPYGPGRAAWISTVNKLAAGLDPSCTHIRKQTHESMCILKERLNDDFEYSGDLNEDYLRGLLGKAVTRRRTKLISCIKQNISPQVHIDEDIWLRLEKLAESEQRENKTEHGKYANGCRRLVSRTGSVGETGVRERLRELYGRSPDPDEVLEEMHRHKGSGEAAAKSRRISRKEMGGETDELIEDRHEVPEFTGNAAEEYINENRGKRRTEVVRKNVSQVNKELVDILDDGKDRLPQTSDENCRKQKTIKTSTTSTEEYIKRLEAEIQMIRGLPRKSSSSRAVLNCDSRAMTLGNMDVGEVGYGRESSRVVRSEGFSLQRRKV